MDCPRGNDYPFETMNFPKIPNFIRFTLSDIDQSTIFRDILKIYMKSWHLLYMKEVNIQPCRELPHLVGNH